MKFEVTPPMLIGAAIAVVLIIGLLVWKLFGPAEGTMDQATINAHIAAKKARGGG